MILLSKYSAYSAIIKHQFRREQQLIISPKQDCANRAGSQMHAFLRIPDQNNFCDFGDVSLENSIHVPSGELRGYTTPRTTQGRTVPHHIQRGSREWPPRTARGGQNPHTSTTSRGQTHPVRPRLFFHARTVFKLAAPHCFLPSILVRITLCSARARIASYVEFPDYHPFSPHPSPPPPPPFHTRH